MPVVFQLFFKLFSHLHPGTRLTGLGGLGAKTLHKGHLAVKVILEGTGFTLTLGVVFVLKGQKLRVGGLAEHGLGQPEVENMGADIVHEHTVMGYKYQRAAEVHKEGFQPFHGFYVEMVGGFVEQQHVSTGGKHTGQLGALAPAAGEFAQGSVPLVFGKSQTGKHGLGPMLGIVAVERLKLALTVHQGGQARLVLAGGGFFPFGPKVAPVVQHVQHIGQQRRFEGFL